jgi:putative hemolysin
LQVSNKAAAGLSIVSHHFDRTTMILTTEPKSAVLLRSGVIEVKLASSFSEIDAAMRLRFEVFNLELQEGSNASYAKGFDSDAYDAYCDHLIVKDLDDNEVVGTYRMLKRSQADRHIGFYSENEVDLSNLKGLPGELLELGRLCVAKSHRSRGVMQLLWGALMQYALKNRVSYMFGCGSLHCADLREVERVYSYLRRHYLAGPKFQVDPAYSSRIALPDPESEDSAIGASLKSLSPILKGYLRAGAKICGAPAYDPEFGSIDVLVLMEIARMSRRYKQHYIPETQPL